MDPRPVNSEPEQYDVNTYKQGDRVSVTPVAPGDQLDKWRFAVREGDSLVLRKHIGGEAYHANHTMPDGIPFVVLQALRDAGYDVVSPEKRYTFVPRPDAPSYHQTTGANIPVDDDGGPKWGEVADYTEEWARPILEDD